MDANLPAEQSFAQEKITSSQKERASQQRPKLGLFGLYTMIVIIAILSLVYLNIPSYVYVLNESILPKYFYYSFFILIAPLILIRFKAVTAYLRAPFFMWAAGAIILNVAHLYFARIDNDLVRADIIDTRIQYLALAALIGFAFSVTRTALYEGVFPVLAVVAPSMVALDFLKPGVIYPVATAGTVIGRASAMFINPNAAADAMLLILIFAIGLTRPKYRVPLLLTVGIGVFLTFSRGGIIGWMLVCGFMIAGRVIRKYELLFPVIIVVLLPTMINHFGNYLDQRDDLGGAVKNIAARLDFFHTHSLEDDSTQARVEVLRAGGNLFLNNPVFGAGGGATFTWTETVSTHNQLILLAAEYGVFGIILWFWLAMILWKGKYFQDNKFQLAIVLVFASQSLFTHNMLDHLFWLTTFAIVSGRRRI